MGTMFLDHHKPPGFDTVRPLCEIPGARFCHRTMVPECYGYLHGCRVLPFHGAVKESSTHYQYSTAFFFAICLCLQLFDAQCSSD